MSHLHHIFQENCGAIYKSNHLIIYLLIIQALYLFLIQLHFFSFFPLSYSLKLFIKSFKDKAKPQIQTSTVKMNWTKMYIACSWNREAAYESQYESGDMWCIQMGAMRHYNQTYQGEPLRGDKVFSTGRFIQGILDVGVT